MIFILKRCAHAVLLSLIMHSALQAVCPLSQLTAAVSEASTSEQLKRYEKLLIKYLPYHIGNNGKKLGAITIAVPLAVLIRAQILCALAAKYAATQVLADQGQEAAEPNLQDHPEELAALLSPAMNEQEKQTMIRLGLAFGAGALAVAIPVLLLGSSSTAQ